MGDCFNESWMEEHSDALEQPPLAGTTAVTSDYTKFYYI